MSVTKLSVLKVAQNSKTIYLAKIKAEDIKKYTTVDRYKSNLSVDHPDQGYQRSAEASRFKKFANYLIKEDYPFCPTAILLSARDFELQYDDQTSSIELNSEQKLQIIDGQHRAEGYRFVIDEKQVESLQGFEVPVIILTDIDKVTEMKQFAVVNGTQKKVRLDLVNMILTQIADRKGEDQVEEKEIHRIVITRAVEKLNTEKSSPWHQLIVMPNEKAPTKREIIEKPELGMIKIIPATSFMTSIKPVYNYLNEHEFIKGDVKEKARALSVILIDFWTAVMNLVPEAFQSPPEYVIQKTPGLFSLHTICRRVLLRLHQAGSDWNVFEFEKLLDRSSCLTNPEFWHIKEGEAAKYGSMKGFSELASIIDEELLDD